MRISRRTEPSERTEAGIRRWPVASVVMPDLEGVEVGAVAGDVVVALDGMFLVSIGSGL